MQSRLSFGNLWWFESVSIPFSVPFMKSYSPAKLLLVEDDRKLADLIGQKLRRVGYEIDFAPDGEAALRLAEGTSDHVLLTDLMLPGIDGLSLLSRLRQQNPKLPVLVLSAKGSVNERVKGLRAGADERR